MDVVDKYLRIGFGFLVLHPAEKETERRVVYLCISADQGSDHEAVGMEGRQLFKNVADNLRSVESQIGNQMLEFPESGFRSSFGIQIISVRQEIIDVDISARIEILHVDVAVLIRKVLDDIDPVFLAGLLVFGVDRPEPIVDMANLRIVRRLISPEALPKENRFFAHDAIGLVSDGRFGEFRFVSAIRGSFRGCHQDFFSE